MRIQAAAVAIAAAAGVARGQGTLTWMGPFPGGGFGVVEATTPDGSAAAGRWHAPGAIHEQAFRWSASGGMLALGSTLGGAGWQAYAISPDGLLTVGSADVSSSEWHACVWSPAGVQTDLGTLSLSTVRYSGAFGAANGAVAGYSYDSAVGEHLAFRWSASAGMVRLFPPPGCADSGALCISANGHAVGGGCRTSVGQRYHATIWTDGVARDLGSLDTDVYADVRYLSPDGALAVGMSGPVNDTSAPGRRAFRWTAARGMEVLFDLQPGYDVAGASADGTVVVYGGVWTEARGMRPAVDVLADYGIVTGGFAVATVVSDDGRRLGGTAMNGTQVQGFVASLPPGLACYPNCDGSAANPVLNVQDFTCFLRRYGTGDTYANCDGSTASPVLSVADFSCFLQKFAVGCP